MKKHSGMSMLSMLLAVMILGGLVAYVMPRYLEVYKGQIVDPETGKHENYKGLKETAQNRVDEINKKTMERSKAYQ